MISKKKKSAFHDLTYKLILLIKQTITIRNQTNRLIFFLSVQID